MNILTLSRVTVILNIAVTNKVNIGCMKASMNNFVIAFYHNPKIEAMLLEKEQQVLKGNLTSFIAARSLLDTYFEDLK